MTASILLVDDHPANLLALEAVLSPLGQRLVRAQSGAEALRLAAHEDFALVLLDVNMPDLDGFETAARMKRLARAKHTPIIFLTAAYSDEEHAFKGYAHGAVDYVVKPFQPAMLRAKVAIFVELFVERERLRRQAEVLRDRERFIGVLGHDLRSPLASIVMGAGLLARRADLPAGALKTVERVARSASRMDRMVRDLLDFTQSREGGGIPATPRPIELAAVCRRVVTEEVAVTHPDRTVNLTVEGDTRGMWDPDRVEQVVTNLVTNALKHGRGGSPVGVRVRDEGGSVGLEVHNEGPPIPAELVPVLFDPFRRGAATAQLASDGLGLGLYIVDQIAHAHGGSVEVTSTAEAGTTFTVHWPHPGGHR